MSIRKAKDIIHKYSHEPSVHVIAGISRRDATPLIFFEGHMNSLGFQSLCDQFLQPFIRTNYPEQFLHMDNAKIHLIRALAL